MTVGFQVGDRVIWAEGLRTESPSVPVEGVVEEVYPEGDYSIRLRPELTADALASDLLPFDPTAEVARAVIDRDSIRYFTCGAGEETEITKDEFVELIAGLFGEERAEWILERHREAQGRIRVRTPERHPIYRGMGISGVI